MTRDATLAPTRPRSKESLAGRARCSDPVFLPLVDAAFDRSGSPAAQELRETACPRCPIAAQCLNLGMAGEYGVWGATGMNVRTRAGAPHPLHGSHRQART